MDGFVSCVLITASQYVVSRQQHQHHLQTLQTLNCKGQEASRVLRAAGVRLNYTAIHKKLPGYLQSRLLDKHNLAAHECSFDHAGV